MLTRSLSLKSSVVASIAAGGFLAAAVVGGQLAADPAAKKGDRFDVVERELCADQTWPNISEACVSWTNAQAAAPSQVRYVTIAIDDEQAGVTELRRIEMPAQE